MLSHHMIFVCVSRRCGKSNWVDNKLYTVSLMAVVWCVLAAVTIYHQINIYGTKPKCAYITHTKKIHWSLTKQGMKSVYFNKN